MCAGDYMATMCSAPQATCPIARTAVVWFFGVFSTCSIRFIFIKTQIRSSFWKEIFFRCLFLQCFLKVQNPQTWVSFELIVSVPQILSCTGEKRQQPTVWEVHIVFLCTWEVYRLVIVSTFLGDYRTGVLWGADFSHKSADRCRSGSQHSYTPCYDY